MTDRAAIVERLNEVIRETFPAAGTITVGDTTTSADVEGWDSLSYSILIMNVEEAFGVELPVERIYELENVGALGDLIIATLARSESAYPPRHATYDNFLR